MKNRIGINIVGAGLAGLAAAVTLAENGCSVRLFSAQPSERAQSVLAAGGINGALNTMGEDDCTENHTADTLRAGGGIADPEAVRGMTEAAPGILLWLERLGVPFNRKPDGNIMLRNFGGQKKKRTAYAKSSTGKMLMSALIDEVRRYEANGLIRRYDRHLFLALGRPEGTERVSGVFVRDTFTGDTRFFYGPVILACGGMNGMFPGRTTGTTANSGDAAAAVFLQGVRFSSLEMLQYHPTTMGIAGKRCLVSEAARGEGGRLFVLRGGEPWYFMDEKYPELKSLMPRDVVSREMYLVVRQPDCGDQVFLDMRHLTEEVWEKRLSDQRAEILHYFALDPKKEPLPVAPGIHYFMGGIDVDPAHRTGFQWLYAAGECCSQYHGANRLGGNSMLGAIYGGRTAAEDLMDRLEYEPFSADEDGRFRDTEETLAETALSAGMADKAAAGLVRAGGVSSPQLIRETAAILSGALGIVRNGETLQEADRKLCALLEKERPESEKARLLLGLAMVRSACGRRESRGAHFREDYPEREDAFCGMMTAYVNGSGLHTQFRPSGR